MRFHFVLDDESLVLVIQFGGELGRDSMMRRLILDYEPFISHDSWENLRLLDRPFAYIGRFFSISAGRLFLGV